VELGVVDEKITNFGVNASYVEILRAQWLLDPATVPQEWAAYFGGDNSLSPVAARSTVAAMGTSPAPAPQSKPAALPVLA